MIVFFHHGGDSIYKYFKAFDNFPVDVHEFCSLEGEKGLIVVPIFYLYLGDLVDGSCDCSFVRVVLDSLLVAYYSVIRQFFCKIKGT